MPVQPLRLTSDPDLACVEIDVLPLQAEGLPLPEPQSQCHRPARGVWAVVSGGEDREALLDIERLELLLPDPRHDGVGARVGHESAALDGGVEARAQDASQSCGALRGALADLVEQVVDVANRQPGQWLFPQRAAVPPTIQA